MIRCKFAVNSIEQSLDWKGREVWSIKMSPVTGNSEENKRHWEATPSGQFVLGTVNKTVVNQLQLGGEYYIDILHVPVPDVPAIPFATATA